jgi:hypothetical protein
LVGLLGVMGVGTGGTGFWAGIRTTAGVRLVIVGDEGSENLESESKCWS